MYLYILINIHKYIQVNIKIYIYPRRNVPRFTTHTNGTGAFVVVVRRCVDKAVAGAQS